MSNQFPPDNFESIAAVSVLLGLVVGWLRRTGRGLVAMMATFLMAPIIGISAGIVTNAFDLGLGQTLAAASIATLVGEQVLMFVFERFDRAYQDPSGAWAWVRQNFRLPGMRPPPESPPARPDDRPAAPDGERRDGDET